jgi:hypothetical protein
VAAIVVQTVLLSVENLNEIVERPLCCIPMSAAHHCIAPSLSFDSGVASPPSELEEATKVSRCTAYQPFKNQTTDYSNNYLHFQGYISYVWRFLIF